VLFSAALACCFALGAAGSPAIAQTQVMTTAAAAGTCRVLSSKSNPEGQQQLFAECGKQGHMLGSVSDFTAIGNARVGAILIDARLGQARRILLLSQQPDGQPLLENLNGEIAIAVGRGPMSDLVGVTINWDEFASAGTLAVYGAAADTGLAKADRIDIGRQIALERARKLGGPLRR
jgi:hypothetical protein